MTYATRSDIETLYSIEALYVADRDGDGAPDDVAITRALLAASSEIDAFIRVRYDVPVLPVPDLLMQFAVDIALYRLAQSASVLSEEHRTRYEDALGKLKMLSEGKMMLPPPPPDPNAPAGDPALDGPRPIVGTGPAKIFTRDQMRDL